MINWFYHLENYKTLFPQYITWKLTAWKSFRELSAELKLIIYNFRLQCIAGVWDKSYILLDWQGHRNRQRMTQKRQLFIVESSLFRVWQSLKSCFSHDLNDKTTFLYVRHAWQKNAIIRLNICTKVICESRQGCDFNCFTSAASKIV